MGQTVDFDIVGSYNNQRVSSIDSERSVNLFEYIDPLGKKPKSLINTSGIQNTNTTFTGTAATDGFRGQFVFLGNEYSVVGAGVYRTDGATNVTSHIGTLINTASGYVGMDANSHQLLIVDGADGYIWDNTANTFTQITDTAFPASPIDCCTLDNFFVVANGNTNQFQLSQNDQGLVWGPDTQTVTADDTPANNWLILGSTLNYQTGVSFVISASGGGSAVPNPLVSGNTYFAIRVDATHIRVAATYADALAGTAIVLTSNGSPTITITSTGQFQLGTITSHPGTIVACRTLHRRLFLFSQFFTEVWENAGAGSNLPFRRNNSLLMEYGTPALGSIAVGFDILIFLSQDRDGLGSVMQVNGTEAMPISNRALDFQLAQYAAAGQISDCRAFLIKENGLIFYRMNFTAANHTFVYGVTFSSPQSEQTKLWHEEEVLNGDRHPAQTHAYFNGNNYVGSYNSPTLYLLDSSLYTNDGEPIRRMRITRPIVPPGYQRIRIDRLQVDLLQGNILNVDTSLIEQDLLSELGFIITTEADVDIILEQALTLGTFNTPYVFLSISRDGGQTYGYRIKAPMGQVGQRTFRTLWRKLGVIPRGQGFVAKFEFFDEMPFIILGASWAMEVLPE